jgi:steroid 5-alpha reductase family enzyme
MTDTLLIISFVIFIYITLGFIIGFILKRNDITDVMWGPGIFLASFTALILNPNPFSFILVFLVFIWAMRIFLHIGKRFLNKKQEDFRYANFRKEWKNFHIRSFLQVFLLQGFLMIVLALSVIQSTLLPLQTSDFFFLLGLLIFIVGFTFETLADLQLSKFLKNKENKGKIMQSGVWKYSRHPNYFGEVSLWWGIFIMSIPQITVFSILSPLCITYLILKVSGIPMLEKKYEGNSEFEIYKAKTSAFFPRFPKQI